MPMLPSGRHIAVQPARLFELIRDTTGPENDGRLFAINTVEDVKRYLDVIELVPIVADDEALTDAAPGSMPLPPGMRAQSTGYSLAECDALSAHWTGADREAFAAFLQEARVNTLLGQWLAVAQEAQQRMSREPDFVSTVLSAWRAAGVHPDQEEGWDDIDRPDWDDYDLVAALATFGDRLDAGAFSAPAEREAIMMLQGYLGVITLPETARAGSIVPSARDLASAWRDIGLLDDGDADHRQWVHDQGVVIADNLWDKLLEASLRSISRDGLGILKLVVVSGEGNPRSAQSGRNE